MAELMRDRLENALRDFEPVFWIGPWGEPLERLYEPDGTLYAICLDGPVELITDRRRILVQRGDLVIIPPAVAIDLDPASGWFGLVYSGPYPYHFRERFIQVWGFEHQPIRQQADGLATNDLRHRIYVSKTAPKTDSPELRFQIQLRLPEPGQPIQDSLIQWAMPGESLQPDSSENLIWFEIPIESVYLSHRQASPNQNPRLTMSPEFKPDLKPESTQ